MTKTAMRSRLYSISTIMLKRIMLKTIKNSWIIGYYNSRRQLKFKILSTSLQCYSLKFVNLFRNQAAKSRGENFKISIKYIAS